MDSFPSDSPIRYRTLREAVQNALMEDILRNRFQPGQRLLEGDLAATYGVSRAPIREAVRALEQQGLLRSVSNKGVMVSRLSPDEIREVYEVRIELEPLAARLAAPVVEESTLTQLRALLATMDTAIEDPKTWLSLNNDFHMVLYMASRRERLCKMIGEMTNVVEPYIRLFLNVPGMLRETHRDHHVILAAAERRDGQECALLVRQHLEGASELIVRLTTHEYEGSR
jgi:DNA-binding GntR family transcriptional regulator